MQTVEDYLDYMEIKIILSWYLKFEIMYGIYSKLTKRFVPDFFHIRALLTNYDVITDVKFFSCVTYPIKCLSLISFWKSAWFLTWKWLLLRDTVA